MNHSKSSLFLMELIISILFFSLASAVCIRLFAKSHLISQATIEQNKAITYAQNLAECWYASEGSTTDMHRLLSETILTYDDTSIFFLFDKEWNIITSLDNDSSYYAAELSNLPDSEGNMLHSCIKVYPLPAQQINRPPREIYSLDLLLHINERREIDE